MGRGGGAGGRALAACRVALLILFTAGACADEGARKTAPDAASGGQGSAPPADAALDGVVEKLERGALVADVGCGHGTSTVIMAQAFPDVWLPRSIQMHFGMMLAVGAVDATYKVDYLNYKQADVTYKIK